MLEKARVQGFFFNDIEHTWNLLLQADVIRRNTTSLKRSGFFSCGVDINEPFRRYCINNLSAAPSIL